MSVCKRTHTKMNVKALENFKVRVLTYTNAANNSREMFISDEFRKIKSVKVVDYNTLKILKHSKNQNAFCPIFVSYARFLHVVLIIFNSLNVLFSFPKWILHFSF
ncbi:hypothetical protein KIL84_019982 [Mauremys mutica]|uniref:Uncharacterized protein n=1 Tax=Mauremys mutica TaxID=74926 RepID=A0A9D3XVZ3_9SAUR|nr:hypothetical protein KIL84_019982 [Mauremys mutica]